MSNLERRTLIKAAAWAAPVLAVAATAPLAAASTPGNTDTPDGVCGTYHSGSNNGIYTVYNDRVVVSYKTVPDIYELNIRMKDGTTKSFGTNYGTGPQPGSLTWVIYFPVGISWAQVHGFADHFGEVC